jgi:hypothetical protein
MKPEEGNRKLFDKFNQIGREIIKDEVVSDTHINELAGTTHLKKSTILLYKVVSLPV